ncbi:MAG: hypothetical protein JW729_11205 [Bacteroidales bacterium]|nr:hypothetical protein [Bacteroidales bacterium]
MSTKTKHHSKIKYWAFGILITFLMVIIYFQSPYSKSPLIKDAQFIASYSDIQQIELKSSEDSIFFVQLPTGEWKLNKNKAVCNQRLSALFASFSQLNALQIIRLEDFANKKLEQKTINYTINFTPFFIHRKFPQLHFFDSFKTERTIELLVFNDAYGPNLWLWEKGTNQAYSLDPDNFYFENQSLLNTQFLYWRDREILHIDLNNLENISIWDAADTLNAYTIFKNQNVLKLRLNSDTNRVIEIDTMRVYSYLHAFKKITAENFTSDSKSEIQDKLKGMPLRSRIDAKLKNRSISLFFYAMPAQKDYQQLVEITSDYDLDRCYILTENRLFTSTFLAIDPLFLPASFFYKKK